MEGTVRDMQQTRNDIRPDMQAAIQAEANRRGLSVEPEKAFRLPESVRMVLIGMAGGIFWAALLGLGLAGVV